MCTQPVHNQLGNSLSDSVRAARYGLQIEGPRENVIYLDGTERDGTEHKE